MPQIVKDGIFDPCTRAINKVREAKGPNQARRQAEQMKISQREIQQRRLHDDTLAEAVRRVRESGFVVLEKTMTRAWTERMREAWDGHLEGRQPGDLLRMPFLDPLAIENPWGVQILEAMMGTEFWAKLPYHCNSTAPNWPERQEVHRDQAHLFPKLPMALPPHMMVIHIPLGSLILQHSRVREVES